MPKTKIKSEKGISVIALGVAVVILLVIASTLIYKASDNLKVNDLNYMYSDIGVLSDKVTSYYAQYQKVPLKTPYTDANYLASIQNSNQKNPNDGDNYYVLDLEVFDHLTLRKGKGFYNGNISDVYIINEKSHTIYYIPGIKVDDKVYYTTPETRTKIMEFDQYGYVKDKLFMHYDAIDNTGNGHNQNTTVWKDLAGNNELSMNTFDKTSTSGWQDNSLMFDGIDDAFTTGIHQNELGQKITISMIFNAEETNNYRGLWGNHYSDGNNINGIEAQYTNGPLALGFGQDLVWIDASLVSGRRVSLTVIMEDKIGTKVYINGVLAGESRNSSTLTPLDTFWIGKSFPAEERFFKGSVSNFKIYTKTLTEEEIRHNYEVDQDRYQINPYIQNGLTLLLDGKNAPEKIASQYYWRDSSGNGLDAKLVGFGEVSTKESGYSSTDKAYILDGQDDGFSLGNQLKDIFKGPMTIEIVTQFDELSAKDVLIGNVNTPNSISWEKDTSNGNRIWWNDGQLDLNVSGIYDTNPTTLSFMTNKVSATCYQKANVIQTINNIVFADNYDFNNAYIGREATQGKSALKGKIYAVRIYNRILTEEEMKYNLVIDKQQFGI